MRTRLLTSLFLGVSFLAQSQSDPSQYFQGFREEISGTSFGYHSPFPDVNTALLVRGEENYKPIEWRTEIVPENYKGKFITFAWVFSMDVTSDPVKYHLFVNGKSWISFTNSRISETGPRLISGKQGAELNLNTTLLDRNKDQMGFAILKLPVKAIEPGKSVILKVEAEPAGNSAWFMTYRTPIEERVDIHQNKVVIKSEGSLFHSVSVDFIHMGDETKATVDIGDSSFETRLKAGFNKLDINLPKVVEKREFVAEVRIKSRGTQQVPFTLEPVKPWEVFLVQHTHSDIGYTRPQTEILPEHLRYIDNALDFCDQTDHYPNAAQFRWTCETSWSVREYLRSRPQSQIDRLLQRIKEGRIEATGMFLNFSELIDEPALAAQTRTLRMLKNSGIDVTTAMQNDVNGIAWCLVDYFHHTDVKYLTMGIHAHRARIPFNKPTSFWWQSPAGNRLLSYRSEHYMHGNFLSLTTGQQDVFRANLSNYLTSLEEKDYPYHKISLQFSGYITDNSPPTVKVCEIIKDWNEKYEWPKLRSALARDFMIYLDEYHAEEIPEQEVAWPDWWTDGVGSAANEAKVARSTHVEISANTAVLSMTQLLGAQLPDDIQNEIEEVYDNLLFYDEHTYGASESISDPLVENTVNQWNMKSANIWTAAKKSSLLQEKALAFLEPALEKSNLPTIAIFNTLNWKRSDMIELFIQYEVIPEGMDFTITDAEGREVPVHMYQKRSEGAYYGLWVEDVPPMGYKTLQVNLGKKSTQEPPQEGSAFENRFYRIQWDEKKGIISQIYDKELQESLVDPNDTLTLGQFIYEQLSNRHDMERLTNAIRDTVYKPLDLKRTLLSNVELTGTGNGSIYKSIFLHGDMPVCADERGVDIEIRLYHYQKRIELLYDMFKLPVHDPEGVYVAFPLNLKGGKLAFEAQGGIVYPGVNQLAGSSSDWNTIQNFATVRNNKSQIVFASKDIPLVHFGDINIGRYYYRLKPKTNHIYSWVLNNYWVTNFKGSQEGELKWTYDLTSSKDNSYMFATRFGWGVRVPLLSRVMFPGAEADQTNLVSRSLLTLDASNLLMVNTTPSMDGEGIILHLREVEGGHAILDTRRLLEETGAASIEEVNVLEERLTVLTSPLLIEHFETKFIKLNFED